MVTRLVILVVPSTMVVITADEGYPGDSKSELADVTAGYVPEDVTEMEPDW